MKRPLLFLACALALLRANGDEPLLRTVAALSDFADRTPDTRIRFELTAVVLETNLTYRTNDYAGTLLLEDATGRAYVFYDTPRAPRPGDVIRASGDGQTDSDRYPLICVRQMTNAGQATLPGPVTVALGDLTSRDHDYRLIRTEGTLIDVFQDEMDDDTGFLLLKDGPTLLPVAISRRLLPEAQTLLGARLRVCGRYNHRIDGIRRFSGPFICLQGAYEVLQPAPSDPFDVPDLEFRRNQSPRDISRLGKRRVSGVTLAAWAGNCAMLRTREGHVVNLAFVRDMPLPAPGEAICAIGYPQTDLYRINLVHARWRPAAPPAAGAPRTERPVDIAAAAILLDSNGCRRVCSDYHGELVRLHGTVRSVPLRGSPEQRLYLDSGPFTVPVDFSQSPQAADGVAIGAEVEITGRCIIQLANRFGHDAFPQATGFMLALRTPADIRVLREPPWLTPARFVLILSVTLAVLLAILVWNVALRLRVNRRSSELLRAQSRTVEAALRTEERTRLAVELHDTLAQNLTGVSMEIETATRCADEGLAPVLQHLHVADRALKSCRNELRNTLWDLRNQSLETTNLDQAIRRTLLPHVKGVDLAVRVDVARTRFTDRTLHEILHIIRELVLNGIRHGHATRIRIAGSVADGTLLISVRDNGCGFDPSTAPGMTDGHFGLQGVRERLSALAGRLTLDSRLGVGTKARLSIPLPRTERQGEAHASDNRPAR